MLFENMIVPIIGVQCCAENDMENQGFKAKKQAAPLFDVGGSCYCFRV
jgi:hypothetical protein